MSPITEDRPMTATSVLFADPASPVAPVAELLANAGVYSHVQLAQLPLDQAGLQQVERDLVTHVSAILRTDLLGLLVDGWRKFGALQDAARFSVDKTEELTVPLAAHRIETMQTWSIDVLVYGLTITTTDFLIAATFDIDVAQALVCASRLVGLQGGRCEIIVRLEVQTKICKRATENDAPYVVEKHRTVDLGARLKFGSGIPLLRSQTASLPG